MRAGFCFIATNLAWNDKERDMKKILWIVLLILSVLLTPDIPYAYTIGQSVGIASSPNPVGSGARAVGMGGAFIAIADDATAASWNPAGLTHLETPEISIVGAYGFRYERFSSSSNPESNSDVHASESSINYLSASYPFNFLNKNMVVSLNYQRLYEFNRSLDYNWRISTPPLLSTQNIKYEQNGYLSALGLAYAIEVTPAISVGMTLNLWTSRLGWQNGWEADYTNHNTVTVMGLTTFDDWHINEKYSDLRGVNMNFGLLWKVNKQLTIGAVLKTPFTARFDHQYTSDRIMRDINGNIIGSSHTSISEEVDLQMPMSYGIGFAWRFSDEFTIDLDVYRTHWSDYILTDGQGNKMSPINALPQSRSNVKDTTQVRLGGDYIFIKPHRDWTVSLRGGMFYDPEPAQEAVKDFYGFSIGTGISYKRYNFDIAYQLRWGKSVDAYNQIPTSQADIMQHLILCSFILHF
jgi:long-subunit fatty acid transport protein